MIYMLDTDTCSYIMRVHSQSVLEELEKRAREVEGVCISVITYQELRFGAERASTDKYHVRIDEFCDRIDFIADWSTEEADLFAKVQCELLANGTPIGENDTMIATHAMTNGATLVTNNVKHFSRVSGLTLENWLT